MAYINCTVCSVAFESRKSTAKYCAAHRHKAERDKYYEEKGISVSPQAVDSKSTFKDMDRLDKAQEQIGPKPTTTNPLEVPEIKKIVKEMLNEQTIRDDPILRFLGKYGPALQKFAQGFTIRQQELRQEKQQKVQSTKIPRPPPDYGTIKGLTHREWDEATKTHKYPPAYQQQIDEWEAYKGRVIAQKQGTLPTQDPQADNLKDLSRQYGEPPLVEDVGDAGQGQMAQEHAPQETQAPTDNGEKAQLKEIVGGVQMDLQEKMVMLVGALNSMDTDKFKKGIKNPQKIVEGWLGWLQQVWIPKLYRVEIMNIGMDDLEKTLEDQCKEKWDLLKKHRKVKKFKEAVVWMQEELKKEFEDGNKQEEDDKEVGDGGTS